MGACAQDLREKNATLFLQPSNVDVEQTACKQGGLFGVLWALRRLHLYSDQTIVSTCRIRIWVGDVSLEVVEDGPSTYLCDHGLIASFCTKITF